MAVNTLQYARKKWRDNGYTVEAGEHVSRIGSVVRRHDTFGFADLLCVQYGRLVLLQVTSWSNVSARINKIANGDHGSGQYRKPIFQTAVDLLAIPGVRIVVEGWKLNTHTNRWESREVEVTESELISRRDIPK